MPAINHSILSLCKYLNTIFLCQLVMVISDTTEMSLPIYMLFFFSLDAGLEFSSDDSGVKKPVTPLASPKDVFQDFFPKVCDVLPEHTLTKFGNDLAGARLVSYNVLDVVLTNNSLSRYEKVNKYMVEIRRSLAVDDSPKMIVLLAKVLKKQNNRVLHKIASSMLTKIGTVL